MLLQWGSFSYQYTSRAACIFRVDFPISFTSNPYYFFASICKSDAVRDDWSYGWIYQGSTTPINGSGSKGNGLHPKYATTSGYTDLPFKWIAIGPA